MGKVIILKTVLINVALETKSGFVSNCTAIKVVFAAVGIAASKIIICFVISSTGRINVKPNAMIGAMSNLSTNAMPTFVSSIRLNE